MMDRDQMDVIDLIINTMKEHEKFLSELSFRLESTMKMIQQFTSHTLAEGKLGKLEEFIEFKKARHLEEKELGAFTSPETIIEEYDKILQIIRSGG